MFYLLIYFTVPLNILHLLVMSNISMKIWVVLWVVVAACIFALGIITGFWQELFEIHHGPVPSIGPSQGAPL
jgi:predicted permease